MCNRIFFFFKIKRLISLSIFFLKLVVNVSNLFITGKTGNFEFYLQHIYIIIIYIRMMYR